MFVSCSFLPLCVFPNPQNKSIFNPFSVSWLLGWESLNYITVYYVAYYVAAPGAATTVNSKASYNHSSVTGANLSLNAGLVVVLVQCVFTLLYFSTKAKAGVWNAVHVYADCRLTDTLSSLSAPAAVELADATRHPPSLISSITVVFTGGTVVVPIRGAGEVSMQRWR